MQQFAPKVKEETQQIVPKWYSDMIDSPTFRGGVLGAIITAFVSWNTGINGRIGMFLKHWGFVRRLVSPKRILNFAPITKYHHPCLDIAANNFYCYSGESGIGKSRHFQEMVSEQSLLRPTLYVSFKAVGRKQNFENDLAEQLNFGSEIIVKGGIVGEIVRAIKEINNINQKSESFKLKYLLTNLLIVGSYASIIYLPFTLDLQIALLGPLFLAQCEYLRFMQPLLRQSNIRTIPLVVFDDLNKLEHLGMLAEITRFFKILEARSANLMMISSNEETWSKLRRQPGMKDRLRIRQLKYDYSASSVMLIDLIIKKPQQFKKYFTCHPLFTIEVIKELAKIFIGVKQMSIRRFSSVLKLVDEEEYQKLIGVLKNPLKLSPQQVVLSIRDIIFQTEVHTMVTQFRIIKRQLPKMSQQTFINTLKVVIRHHKLPSDNKVGALLKVYNIMRDTRGQYVINGGYMAKIFQMAIEQYRTDIEMFDMPSYKQHDFSSEY